MQIQTRHPVLTFQQLFSPSIPVCRVLGYPTAFIHCMLRINLHSRARIHSALRSLVFPIALLFLPGSCALLAGAQRVHLPSSKAGIADLESKTQSRHGDITSADGDVDIHFGDTRLRADHVEYNSKTFEAVATGHVQLDYNNEHLMPTKRIITSAPATAFPQRSRQCQDRTPAQSHYPDFRQSALFRSS
jgi:hypothetical protein